MFNKKLKQRVRKLEDEAIKTHELINQLFEELKKPKCFSQDEMIPEDTSLIYLWRYTKAIIDYLKIDIEEFLEDDPAYLPPRPIQRKVWRAKKKTIKN